MRKSAMIPVSTGDYNALAAKREPRGENADSESVHLPDIKAVFEKEYKVALRAEKSSGR